MHKRRWRAEMAASTSAKWVSSIATTKGGGPHVWLFLFMLSPSSRSPKRKGFFTAIFMSCNLT